MSALRRSLSQTSLGSGRNAVLLGANPTGTLDLRDLGTGLPCPAKSPKAMPSSSSDALALPRPSSGQRNSMTRLPDEGQGGASSTPLCLSNRERQAIGPLAPLPLQLTAEKERVRTPPLKTQGAPPASVAFGIVTSPSSRPGSSGSKSRAASLTRLPDDMQAAAMLQTPLPLLQQELCAGSTEKASPSSPSGKSNFRDRFNKKLSVATQGQPTSPAGKVFRTLQGTESISDYYDFEEEIYSAGSKGKVVIAKRKSDNVEVVVKIRTKSSNRSCERTWRAIMTQVHELGGSRHVLNIMEIIESPTDFYVVMPKCTGGELFEFLANEAEVPEAECKRIIREILVAVGHLHKNNLIHRDIKPENIMFDMPVIDRTGIKTPKTVKLIDFDTCFEWSPTTPKSRRFVGTPGYIAPEALMGEISPKSDLWSVGVILYILMTGEMPWSSLVSLEDGVVGSPGARQMYRQLKAEVLSWDEEPWPDFPLARDLCQKLLAFRTEERMSTVEAALSHPWLKVAAEVQEQRAAS